MSIISDLFTGQDAQQAAAAGNAATMQGLQIGTGQLTAAQQAAAGMLQAASNTYGTAQNYWNPLSPSANAAFSKYAQLIGATPESTPGSVEATLTSQPGFQTQMDLALQAANRTAAAGGMGNSGNAILAAQNQSRQLEEANINNYAQRLLALAGYAPTIATAQTGIVGQQAGTQAQQAANAMTTGGLEAGLTTGAYNTVAQNDIQAALAQQQAAANVWNAVMGVAGLGVKAATGGIIPGITPTKSV